MTLVAGLQRILPSHSPVPPTIDSVPIFPVQSSRRDESLWIHLLKVCCPCCSTSDRANFREERMTCQQNSTTTHTHNISLVHLKTYYKTNPISTVFQRFHHHHEACR
jgi:hypothetical protein